MAIPDTRTAAQRKADEAVAVAAETGNWGGFEFKALLAEEGAKLLVEHQAKLEEASERDPSAIMRNALNQPFRWREKVFMLTRCEYVGGKAVVEATPHDEAFIEELKRRIEADPFHHLNYCQRFGLICLPEDYAKYEH